MYPTYDIFEDLLKIRETMDTIFSDKDQNLATTNPYVNIYEDGDNLELRTVLPGVQKEDLNIELSDNIITLSGEKKRDSQDANYLRRERSCGKFQKSIKLPYNVNNEKINAELEDGILTIRLVKSEEAKPRKIELN